MNVKTSHAEGPYIGLENVESWTGRLLDASSEAIGEGQSNLFDRGDVLFGKLRPYLAKVHRASAAGRCTSELLVLRPIRLTGEYLRYVLASEPFIRLVDSSTFGAKMPRADWEYIGHVVVPAPPVPTQRAISDFLDRKTAAIDALVAKAERATELLLEARIRTVTDAVTSGLGPTLRWRASGDDILGQVPAHWAVQRVSTVAAKLCNGYVGPTRDILVDEGVPYLQSLHIKSGAIRFGKPYYVTSEWLRRNERIRLRSGDVVIVQTGDIGQVAAIPPEWDGSGCHALIIFRPRSGVALGEFISWFFQSHVGRELLRREQTGALHPHLEVGKVREIRLPLPPLQEQSAIVRALNEGDEQFRRRTATLDEQLRALREYRQALITAAVTGQLDVAAQPQEAA